MKNPQKESGLIKKACEFISENEKPPSLRQVAKHIGLSPSHFHRKFAEALGVTPRGFTDARRQERFKSALKSGDEISGALYDAGYGSTSRIYEFAHKYLGMTPGEYRQGGQKQTIWYTIVRCPLGLLIVAATEKGLCLVSIGDTKKELVDKLKKEFHAAELIEKDENLKEWTQALIDYLSGTRPWPLLPYDVKATAFQRRVWEYLRAIPPGKTEYYSQVAKAIGKPKAARAVARACATNRVALVIPCHRITPKSGGVGGYALKPERKRKLLKLEKNG